MRPASPSIPWGSTISNEDLVIELTRAGLQTETRALSRRLLPRQILPYAGARYGATKKAAAESCQRSAEARAAGDRAASCGTDDSEQEGEASETQKDDGGVVERGVRGGIGPPGLHGREERFFDFVRRPLAP